MDNCVETALFGTVCDSCDGGAIYKILAMIIKILSTGVGVLAVLGIIIGGVIYLTSSGDASRMAKAKTRITEVVIGLVVYGVMFTVLEFLIPGGVLNSTLDSSTTSCPTKQEYTPSATQTGTQGQTQTEQQQIEQPEQKQQTTSGYPWVTVAGTPSAGSIKCPRNADRTYYSDGSPAKGKKDDYYQSVAQSCPFTAVTYTDDAQDEMCASGGTMHYVADKNWCIVNTKIDVFEYEKYLNDNYIKQDGKTCLTNGQCSSAAGIKDGDPCYKPSTGSVADYKARIGNTCDWGACNYFANTYATNLNNGEVVSNDAFAAQFGRTWWDGWRGLVKYGTSAEKTTWNGRTFYEYSDGLTGQLDAGRSPSGPGNMNTILNELRSGKVTAAGVRSGRAGGGHYLTVIGYTSACAKSGGAYKSCSQYDLVVLNTNSKISTLRNTVYCLGYSNGEMACPSN